MWPSQLDHGAVEEVNLNIAADQVHPFITLAFPKRGGLFQLDYTPCHIAKTVEEWFFHDLTVQWQKETYTVLDRYL